LITKVNGSSQTTTLGLGSQKSLRVLELSPVTRTKSLDEFDHLGQEGYDSKMSEIVASTLSVRPGDTLIGDISSTTKSQFLSPSQ